MSKETKNSLPDHDSDPARTPGDGWVDEGGASHLGPATHTRLTEPDEGSEGPDADAEELDEEE